MTPAPHDAGCAINRSAPIVDWRCSPTSRPHDRFPRRPSPHRWSPMRIRDMRADQPGLPLPPGHAPIGIDPSDTGRRSAKKPQARPGHRPIHQVCSNRSHPAEPRQRRETPRLIAAARRTAPRRLFRALQRAPSHAHSKFQTLPDHTFKLELTPDRVRAQGDQGQALTTRQHSG